MFVAGLLVIGAAKLVIVLAVYRLLLLACRSERIASIATLIYLANPNFLFFDAEFSYESLALPFAVATLALVGVALQSRRGAGRRRLAALAALVGCAVAPTHHITSYALLVILAGWARRAGHRAIPSPVGAWSGARARRPRGDRRGCAVWLAVVGQRDRRLPAAGDHRRRRIDLGLPDRLGRRQDPLPFGRRGQLAPRAGTRRRLGAGAAGSARRGALAPSPRAARDAARLGARGARRGIPRLACTAPHPGGHRDLQPRLRVPVHRTRARRRRRSAEAPAPAAGRARSPGGSS